MRGVGKKIKGLNTDDSVTLLEEGQVPGQGGGIAGNIDEAPGRQRQQGFYHLGMHAGPGRVGDHHIRPGGSGGGALLNHPPKIDNCLYR